MPKSAFNALKNSLRAFLGGAEITLHELEKGEEKPIESEDKRLIIKDIQIDGIRYLFRAHREELAFTAMESDFICELMLAFEGLFAGFTSKGFSAHFRTALLTSLTDIAVTRYIRGDRKGVFWPTQSLV